jgi:hypothetical protein
MNLTLNNLFSLSKPQLEYLQNRDLLCIAYQNSWQNVWINTYFVGLQKLGKSEGA